MTPFGLRPLLANQLLAVRLDKSKLVVWGLSAKGKSKVLPVYLRHWTRMGQMRAESLGQLLTLGEPEAVVAAVCAPQVSPVRWKMPRVPATCSPIQPSSPARWARGRVLAHCLLEFLPFETETEEMTASVWLILQPGLIGAADRLSLGKKSARKQAYLVDLLQALPDDLPQPVPARSDAEVHARYRPTLVQVGNLCAALLLRCSPRLAGPFLRPWTPYSPGSPPRT